MNVVVIGAGVVGLVSAWELLRAGCSVTVFERDEPGAGASNAAAGMLAPVAEARYGEMGLTKLCLESVQRWPDFARELEATSGIDIGYRTEGTLVVAVDRDDLEQLAHTHRLHNELGLEAHMLDGAAARELEPALAPGVPGAVHCPGDHQVDPRSLVRALVAAVEAAGGKIVRGEVEDLDVDDMSLRIEDTIPDMIVVSAGAWTRKLGLRSAPHVRPVRGQMLSVELGEPPLCRHVIRAPDAYLVPKSDGRLVIGATMEEVGFDPRLTAGGLMDLLVGAWEAVPAVYDQPIVETWTGFRPMTLDNEPVMERSDVYDNVTFATGHGRNGILLAPVTGQRVRDIVLR